MSTLTNSRKHRPGGACVSPSVIAFGPTEAGLVAHRHRQADERPLRQVGAELEHDAASAHGSLRIRRARRAGRDTVFGKRTSASTVSRLLKEVQKKPVGE